MKPYFIHHGGTLLTELSKLTYSPLRLSSNTQQYITSLFVNVRVQKWSDLQKVAKKKITTSAWLPTISLLFSFLSFSLPRAHLHSSPHLFFPFCCQATDRKSITWRYQNHRKSLQEDDTYVIDVAWRKQGLAEQSGNPSYYFFAFLLETVRSSWKYVKENALAVGQAVTNVAKMRETPF